MREVTQELLSEGYKNRYGINNGGCEDWAQRVMSRLWKSKYRVEIWATPFAFAETNHVFLRINGSFYDAECVNGRDDHMDLPIFSRLLKDGYGRQPVWLEHYNSAAKVPVENRRDMPDEMVEDYDHYWGTNNSGMASK
jgi:hypothetical protein